MYVATFSPFKLAIMFTKYIHASVNIHTAPYNNIILLMDN